jgi:hypothetical protein
MGMDSTMMPPPDSGMDATADTSPPTDTSPPPNDAPPPDAADAGDGSMGVCNFATVVQGLVANDTNATAAPVPISTFNGCTDDMMQSDYPASFFQ